MRLRTSLWLLVVLSVIAAACGGGNGDGGTDDGQPDTTLTETTMAETMDDGSMDDMDDDGSMDDTGDGSHGEHDDENGHDHEHGDTVATETDISVSIDVTENDDGGYTVAIVTTNFTFDEGAVDGEHVDGFGHAHIYLDGEKLGRVFTDTYELDPMEPGEHQVRVELNSNDHRVYTKDGLAIQDVATVVVGETSAADLVIEMEVAADGTVTGETRYEAALGETVEIRVTSEVTEELHLHGYDLFADLQPGETASLMFVADVPGIFEAELEGSGTELLTLEVS